MLFASVSLFLSLAHFSFFPFLLFSFAFWCFLPFCLLFPSLLPLFLPAKYLLNSYHLSSAPLSTETGKMYKKVFCPLWNSWSWIREQQTQDNWKEVIMEFYKLLQEHSTFVWCRYWGNALGEFGRVGTRCLQAETGGKAF